MHVVTLIWNSGCSVWSAASTSSQFVSSFCAECSLENCNHFYGCWWMVRQFALASRESSVAHSSRFLPQGPISCLAMTSVTFCSKITYFDVLLVVLPQLAWDSCELTLTLGKISSSCRASYAQFWFWEIIVVMTVQWIRSHEDSRTKGVNDCSDESLNVF